MYKLICNEAISWTKNKCDEYFDNGNIPLNHKMEINLHS